MILELLERYQTKAVFFMIGKQVEENTDLVKEIHQKGHEIGNHSFYHSNRFSVFSVNKMLGEVEETNELIERTIGEKPVYFRPPFGVTNPRIHRLIKRSGMKSVAWSFRSFDGGKKSKESIIKSIKNKIKGGEILLFHDNRKQTVEILEEVLPWLHQNYNLNSNLENAV
jgi:peptidoglycan/xylan/chitin deacetylase (PgdA/CDA1 family)